jgi:Zn-dependent protease
MNTRPDRQGSRPASHGYVRLGRYADIAVRAHWSLPVIVFLATQTLAVAVLPRALPGHHLAAYWLFGAAAVVVFVASVLIHELAHALTARRYGIGVRQITLWMLGGATELDGDPDTPRAEAAIAASGPAASLALGGLFAGLAWLSHGPQLPMAALAWLAGVNLLLGLFNLLPAAQLDGGRLLRAVLWRHNGDRIRATQASSRTGSVLGMVLIGLGVFQVLNGLIVGLWLAVVGWFVINAASAERQAAAGKRRAARVARDIMTSPPAVAPAWWSITDLVAELQRGYVGQQVFPLVDFSGKPHGLITLRDIERVPPSDRDATALREASRSRMPALAVAPDTPLADLLLPIRAHGGIAVVVEDDRAIGTVSYADLSAALTLANLNSASVSATPWPIDADTNGHPDGQLLSRP